MKLLILQSIVFIGNLIMSIYHIGQVGGELKAIYYAIMALIFVVIIIDEKQVKK